MRTKRKGLRRKIESRSQEHVIPAKEPVSEVVITPVIPAEAGIQCRVLVLLLLFLVAACKEMPLYHNLSEGDANEIIVVLYEAGINATKEKEIVQNETFWTVTVKAKDLAEARKLLLDRNLPRKGEMGLSGVYKDKGLIPTPDEQKARFLLAIKGEIINSLEKIPEVVDADVVINIPTPEEFRTNEAKRPTASVVLKVRAGAKIMSQLTEAKIQQFVANSVEELNPRDVSVIISYVSPEMQGAKPGETNLILPETIAKEGAALAPSGEIVSVAGITVSKLSATRFKIYLSIFFAVLILMSAVLVVNVIRSTRLRHEFKALSGGGDKPLIEGEVAESRPRLEAGETDDRADE